MPRGGKRQGAGRLPELDPETAMLIRRDCEQRANVQRRQQADERRDRKLAKHGFDWGEDKHGNSFKDKDGNRIHVIRMADKYRAELVKYGHENGKARIPDNLPDNAYQAIEVMRANRDRGFFGAYSEPLPRLYGSRQAIIDAVAADWSAIGVRVSPRMVRTIWETLEAPADDL